MSKEPDIPRRFFYRKLFYAIGLAAAAAIENGDKVFPFVRYLQVELRLTLLPVVKRQRYLIYLANLAQKMCIRDSAWATC